MLSLPKVVNKENLHDLAKAGILLERQHPQETQKDIFLLLIEALDLCIHRTAYKIVQFVVPPVKI